MALTRCKEGAEEFPCEVRLTRNAIVITGVAGYSYDKQIGMVAIDTVERLGNMVRIKLLDGTEVSFQIRAELIPVANYILRKMELRGRVTEVVEKSTEVAMALATVLEQAVSVVFSLRRTSIPNWRDARAAVRKLIDSAEGLEAVGIRVKDEAQALLDKIEGRMVSGARASVAKLIRSSTLQAKEVLKSLMEHGNLAPIADVVTLIVAYRFARMVEKPFEAERIVREIEAAVDELMRDLLMEKHDISRAVDALMNVIDEEVPASSVVNEFMRVFGEAFVAVYGG